MNVLLMDMGSDYVDHTRGLARKLQSRGCQVTLPSSMTEFSTMIGLASHKGWLNGHRPDVVVNLHFQSAPHVVQAIQLAQVFKTKVINPVEATLASQDRVNSLAMLTAAGIKTPRFFFGHPSLIPTEFGEEVVVKQTNGHLVLKVRTSGIHSLEEVLYCEEVVANPTGKVRTVYNICGEVFTVAKTDTLQSRVRGPKEIIEDDADEVDVVRQIQSLTGLHFFNVDFIGGLVIDVNPFPNFFFHERAVEVFEHHVVRLAQSAASRVEVTS